MDAGLYPAVNAPVFSINGDLQHGGYTADNAILSMTVPGSSVYTIWYTTDGADPRKGPSSSATSVTFIPEAADKKVWVARSNIYETLWTGGNEPFNDSAWTDGLPMVFGKLGGVGYETNPGIISAMTRRFRTMSEASCTESTVILVPISESRSTVTADQLSDLGTLTLKVRYDDGFVAYINGSEVYAKHQSTAHRERPSHLTKRSPQVAARIRPDSNHSISPHSISATSTSGQISWPFTASMRRKPMLILSFPPNWPGPRRRRWALSPTAIRYNSGQPPVLNLSRQVKARAITAGGEWSALNETVFAVGPVKESFGSRS